MTPGNAKLINLAFRVSSIAATENAVDGTSGWRKVNRHEIDGEEYLEATFAGIRVNFFQKTVYDQEPAIDAVGFLHASFEVPSLSDVLDSSDWRDKLRWGPAVIKGGFGHRRIAFFEPVPGCRIELMEDLDA